MIVPNRELTNIEAVLIGKNHGINIKPIMKDQLGNNPQLGYYLVNLENHNQSGSHWCALILSKELSFWFDPYGAPPPKEITNILKLRYKQKVYFSDFIIQDLNSILCGYFCLGLMLVIKNFKNQHALLTIISHFLDYFNDNPKQNDMLIRKLLSNY